VFQTILHLDLDAFFCAVEELRQPDLRGQPFAVGGRPGERGVVSSCSYAARRYGIRSGMPMAQAVRLLPGLKVVSGRHGVYGEMSDRVMERLRDVTPVSSRSQLMKPSWTSPDCVSRPDSGAKTAGGNRERLGLPSSIASPPTSLSPKIATEVGKKAGKGDRPPFGLTIVPVGEERAFLAPLPMEMLWGVGPKTSGKLAALGMRTIGDIAAWPETSLIEMFGEYGHELARRSRGEERPDGADGT